MKKTISTLFLIAMLTVVTLAQTVPPPCPKGHIETPGFVCTVLPADRPGSDDSDEKDDGEINHGTKRVSDDSFISIITEWFSAFGLFGK